MPRDVSIEILEKTVTIKNLPDGEDGEKLERLIKRTCSRSFVYGLFYSLEFKIGDYEKSKAIAFVDSKRFFELRKPEIKINIARLKDLLERGESVIAHEIVHQFQLKNSQGIEKFHKVKLRMGSIAEEHRVHAEEALKEMEISRGGFYNILYFLGTLRMIVIDCYSLIWIEGLSNLVGDFVDLEKGEYIGDKDEAIERITSSTKRVAKMINNKWAEVIKLIEQFRINESKVLMFAPKELFVVYRGDAMGLLGRAMAESMLLSGEYSLDQLMKMEPKEFIKKYEGVCERLDVIPLVTISSGKGDFDVKRVMAPIGRLYFKLKRAT